MSIQKRLSLFTAGLVTLLSCILGGILLQQNFIARVGEIELDLDLVSSAVSAAETDKVTTALSLVQEVGTPISIVMVDPDGDMTPLLEASTVNTPDSYEAMPTMGNGIEQWGNYRIGFAELEGDSRLLFLATTAVALDQRKQDLITLACGLVLVLVLSLSILRLVIARDIKIERGMIEKAERARVAAKHREDLIEFAGDASHELRTPLTVIKGYLEILRRNGGISDGSSHVEIMWREAVRMEETLNQLLELLANEAIVQSQEELIDLSRLLHDKVSNFKPLNPGRAIEVEIEDGVVITGRTEAINRVLDNLLMNIHKHTSERDSVYVLLEQVAKQVVLEIHDGGSGLENLDAGFAPRPFKRFDKSRSRETGGAGLGLSIVESSVKLLGGALLFSRSHLGGLAIRIELPLSNSASH